MQFTLVLASALAAIVPAALAAPANVAARSPTPPEGSPIRFTADQSKCLEAQKTNGAFANNSLVEINDCDDSNTAQKWFMPEGAGQFTAIQLAPTINLSGPAMCLDAGDEPWNNGNPAKIFTCFPNLDNQNWVYTTDQKIALVDPGKVCLDLPAEKGTTNGNTIQLWNCGDGQASQEQWTI